MDYKDVNLKPWQEDLLKHIEIQTDRLIIWVVGRKGGEGKTWFQEFIASRFGWDRVVCGMDIKVKKASICHALRKRPLTTTYIFLFNVGKSFSFNDVNYKVLEKIKDGRILASKFDSMELRFKTPNVVVVFSNDKPKENQLSKDRWLIFNIQNENLIEITKTPLIPKSTIVVDGDGNAMENFKY